MPKHCPFASTTVVMKQESPRGLALPTDAATRAAARMQVVDAQFLAAPCIPTCQFFHTPTQGCCLAAVGQLMLSGAAQIANQGPGPVMPPFSADIAPGEPSTGTAQVIKLPDPTGDE